MEKSKLLDRCGAEGEDRLLLAKVLDRAEQAVSRSVPAHTDFLSPQQQAQARELLHLAGIPEIGELKAGYHADFITLSEDILSVDPMKIDQVYVTATYVDGEKVYESEAKS